jgi:hypothetical protein
MPKNDNAENAKIIAIEKVKTAHESMQGRNVAVRPAAAKMPAAVTAGALSGAVDVNKRRTATAENATVSIKCTTREAPIKPIIPKWAAAGIPMARKTAASTK